MKWTSEAVSKGHPDKVADQVADAVLDSCLKDDPFSKVACEVTLTSCPGDYPRGVAFITGEITTESDTIDKIPSIVREAVAKAGYDNDETHFNANTIEIVNCVKAQSPEIQNAVFKESGELGAGDQGMMFGYATNATPTYMPLAHFLSFKAIALLEKNPEGNFFPDAKTQVTIEQNHVDTILISTCHKPGISIEELNKTIDKYVLWPLREEYPQYFRGDEKVLINPAGLWNVGGPAADTGLSGRKIVVDNYGSDCPIGGGSFSGKDPSKVDRSAAYAARHIAKNLVATGLIEQCQVQLSYAIGIVEPVSLNIDAQYKSNTWKERTYDPVLNQTLIEIVSNMLSFSPQAIIDRFQLRRPIYQATASGGHFGRDEFPWEEINLKDALYLLISSKCGVPW